MNDCLKIIKIQKKSKRIDYIYEANGKWQEVLNLKENMFIEYDVNIEDIPDSIAIIPLMCNILPISWIFDLTIKVEAIDEEFYKCIPKIKEGYSNMHPMINMLGNIEYTVLQKNEYEAINTGALFSGGVDAFNTLYNHIAEKPILLTAWGADISLEDESGWNRVKEHHMFIANKYKLGNSFAKTNFRTFINYSELTGYVRKKANREWWHDFQHGIGILGLFAPIAYIEKIKVVYIASSFTADYKGRYVCASDPTIDNYLRFASCMVSHDGYEYNRQDKIHNICKYIENSGEIAVPIRVCWETEGGNNCCECEKCYRTIMGIIAEKKEPQNFGFELTQEKRKKMIKRLPKIVKYSSSRYLCIQKRFVENYNNNDMPKDLLWFSKIKIHSKKPKYITLYERIISKLKRIVKRILNKR